MVFEGIFGHYRQKELILSFIKKERIPHAFLFSGQVGIGKKSMGLQMAKALLCETKEGCGSCRSCRKVEKDVHPDLLLLGKESDSTGIDFLRLLKEEIYSRPFEGERRVIIINNVEEMAREALNALLKTLEEPPPFNLFILITSSEGRIPLTIRSRCVRIYFNPLRREEIEEFLIKIQKVDKGKAKIVSSISFGSIGVSLFWLEEKNLLLRRKLSEVLTGKWESAMEITLLSEKLSEKMEGTAIFLFFLLSFFKDLYILNKLNDASLILNRDLLDIMTHKRFEPSFLIDAMKMIKEAYKNLFYNVNRWVIVEHLLFKLLFN